MGDVMADESRGKKHKSGGSGLAFVGCLMIGLALGIYTGDVAVWVLGSLGVGFIALAVFRALTGEW